MTLVSPRALFHFFFLIKLKTSCALVKSLEFKINDFSATFIEVSLKLIGFLIGSKNLLDDSQVNFYNYVH